MDMWTTTSTEPPRAAKTGNEPPPQIDPATSLAAPKLEAHRLHQRIQKAVLEERRAIREIALGLSAMRRGRFQRQLGYADLAEYGEQCFGFKTGKTRQLARLGDRLPELPVLSRALDEGEIGWSKARYLAQVATRETDGEWVLAGLQHTCRELEEMVSRTRRGDPPREPTEEIDAPRFVWASIRFEAQHYEMLMRALTRIRRKLGDPDLSLGQLMLILSERELAGDHDRDFHGDDAAFGPHPPPEGDVTTTDAPLVPGPAEGNLNSWRASYLIVAHRCPECDRAWMETRTGKVELGREARSQIEEDAEVINGDDSAGPIGHMGRTIPPATRRAVLARDGCRCRVPGCRHDRYLALHHLKPFSEGGTHTTENLVTVCTTHHDLLHRDVIRARIRGDGSLGWTRGGGEPLATLLSMDGDHAELDHGYLSKFDGRAGQWDLLEPCEVDAALALDGAATPWRRDVSDLRFVSKEERLSASPAARFPAGRSLSRAGDEIGPAPMWMGRPIEDPLRGS
jgi:hypothetical protein